jgi:hypothetical protein
MSKEQVQLAKVHALSFTNDKGEPPSPRELLQQAIELYRANVVYGKLTKNDSIVKCNQRRIRIIEEAYFTLDNIDIDIVIKARESKEK